MVTFQLLDLQQHVLKLKGGKLMKCKMKKK